MCFGCWLARFHRSFMSSKFAAVKSRLAAPLVVNSMRPASRLAPCAWRCCQNGYRGGTIEKSLGGRRLSRGVA